ncbi:MAG: hypothetical protein R3212_01940 [Xanthomonadales bacterium]|nr:hypothetical protein [Xanthomonadales bacterium]
MAFARPGLSLALASLLAGVSIPSLGHGNQAAPASTYESVHFATTWTDEKVTLDFARRLTEKADAIALRMTGLTAELQWPERKLVITLGGPGHGQDMTVRIPYVDAHGNVFLFRYSDRVTDYFNELAHELVHALLRSAGHPYVPFLEEGYADWIATTVDDAMGFPRYGYDADLLAGFLVATNRAIPLEKLHVNRERVLETCMMQAYIQSASLVQYIAATYGSPTPHALVTSHYRAQATGQSDPYLQITGQPLSALEVRWQAYVLKAFGAVSDAEIQVTAYLEDTPISYYGICEPGLR